MLKMVLEDKLKKRLLIKAWVLLVIFITNCSSSGGEEERFKKGEGVSVKLKVDEYIEEINEGLLSRSKMLKGVATEQQEGKGDTEWVLNMGGDEVSVLEFEEKYKKYRSETNKSEDKLSFVLVFLEKYHMLAQAEKYFKERASKEEIEFVKKQLRVQTYMGKKLGLWAEGGSEIKESELLEFYNVLKKQEGYKKLRYENDKEKVRELYRINKINKSYVELESEVKGRYSIEINDEWEGGVVNKYKSGKLDIKQAVRLGEYKKYWLYRINVKGGGKLELYVRDLEKKLSLSKKFFGIGAKGDLNILKSSRNDKESLLNSFLMEELLYLEIDKVFIESNKGVLSELWDKLVLNYYISKKLGIRGSDYVKYMDEYIDREKIGVNRRYFKG